jgi:Mrp family chromosome partitioning ATPase
MSALDRVFIKAYGKSKETRRPAAPPPASGGRRIDPPHAAPVLSELPPPAEPQPPAVTAATPLFQPPDQGRIDARHNPPKPHWALGAPLTPIAPIEVPVAPPSEALTRQAALEPAVAAATSVPPASKMQQAEPEPAPAAPAALRAAFEVDRFLWPETCQKLLAAGSWSDASRELAAASREGQQVFIIASQHRGEGRTTLALCLAQRLSEKKLRVTLVDADFHHPQLARQLKLLPAATWDDVLRGTLPLTESWIESVEDGVTLLPLKERADTTGLIGNPRLKEQFSLLRRMNDIVLIDAGSLEDFTDREVLALLGGTAQIDGALIVRDVRKTAASELDQVPRRLDALGIARVDVVENFVRM